MSALVGVLVIVVLVGAVLLVAVLGPRLTSPGSRGREFVEAFLHQAPADRPARSLQPTRGWWSEFWLAFLRRPGEHSDAARGGLPAPTEAEQVPTAQTVHGQPGPETTASQPLAGPTAQQSPGLTASDEKTGTADTTPTAPHVSESDQPLSSGGGTRKPSTERLRVLIVDDHPVVRSGLRMMLEGEPWVEHVVEAATVAAAVKEAVTEQVHIVAIDVGLPDGDGIDATGRILRALPDVRVLVLTMSDEEAIVARIFDVGAHGYLRKDTDPVTVIDSLRRIAAGDVVLGPGVGLAPVRPGRGGVDRLPAPLDQLTRGEYEILSLLAAGESNARIARKLGVSAKTVRNQLSHVFSKLGVSDRIQAALLAQRMGIASDHSTSSVNQPPRP